MRRAEPLALILLLAAMLGFQATFPQLVDPDGFFHIRAAERVFHLDMPWMPLTVFADGWVDHQLLFHVLMAPFAGIWQDDVLGAKAFAGVLGAAAIFSMIRLLSCLSAPSPWLWPLLAPILSWPFLVRLAMPRTQGLSLMLICAIFWALFTHRPRWLVALGFVFAWTYHVAVVVVPLALLWSIVQGDLRGRGILRILRLPAAAGGGLIAGLVIHPQSPSTLRFLWQHVVLKVGNRLQLPVGEEWRDGGLGPLLRIGGPTLGVTMVAGALAWRFRDRLSAPSRFLLLLATAAHLALLSGTKFIEYAAPFSVLALALILRDAGLDPWAKARPTARAALLALLIAGAIGTGATTAARIRDTEPLPHRVEAAMAWLSAHAEEGEIIYHFDWGDLPELVFHAPQLRYIVGLDPHFLALARPDLWDLYEKIGHGWGKNPSKPIRERFGARWAVLVLPWAGARESLSQDPQLVVRFADKGAVVYEVLSAAEGTKDPSRAALPPPSP